MENEVDGVSKGQACDAVIGAADSRPVGEDKDQNKPVVLLVDSTFGDVHGLCGCTHTSAAALVCHCRRLPREPCRALTAARAAPFHAHAAQVVALVALALGSHRPSLLPVPLALAAPAAPAPAPPSAPAPDAPLCTQRQGPGEPPLSAATAGRPTVVVGTVRMGYGHQRIAAAAASWLSAAAAGAAAATAGGKAGGKQAGGKGVGAGAGAGVGAAVVMHDLTGLECAESALITRADRPATRTATFAHAPAHAHAHAHAPAHAPAHAH